MRAPLLHEESGGSIKGEILTVLSVIGQKGVNLPFLRRKEGYVVRLYVNEKEVPTLIKSIEAFVSANPQCSEAQELLNRIQTCIELQGTTKTKS